MSHKQTERIQPASSQLFYLPQSHNRVKIVKDIVSAYVLYDRAPQHFRPISAQERSDLFTRLSSQYPEFREVFGVLLEALIKYEGQRQSGDSSLPDLLVVITGKGPQKQFFLDKISELQLNHISIVTPWLETEDYPR